MMENTLIDIPGIDPNSIAGDIEPVSGQHNIRPQDIVGSFTTSRGSVYTYDEAGHATRFKTVGGQEQPKQDLTVFVEVRPRDLVAVAAAYLLPRAVRRKRIEVVEIQPGDQPKVVTDVAEVASPDSLRVAILKGSRMVRSRPASLFPKPGLRVFESRRYGEGGVRQTERHLGHKVKSIKPR